MFNRMDIELSSIKRNNLEQKENIYLSNGSGDAQQDPRRGHVDFLLDSLAVP